MSHIPGNTLEDWLTDWYRIVVSDADYGSAFRRIYAGQIVLTNAQFQPLVAMHEPYRERIEYLLSEYNEEDYGSWRDYRDSSFEIPTELTQLADSYLKSLNAPITERWGEIPAMPPLSPNNNPQQR